MPIIVHLFHVLHLCPLLTKFTLQKLPSTLKLLILLWPNSVKWALWGVNLSWQSLFECEINDRVHLCDVTLASLSANWPEAEETSLRAGTPLPNKDSHHFAFIPAAQIGNTIGCENAGQGDRAAPPLHQDPTEI